MVIPGAAALRVLRQMNKENLPYTCVIEFAVEGSRAGGGTVVEYASATPPVKCRLSPSEGNKWFLIVEHFVDIPAKSRALVVASDWERVVYVLHPTEERPAEAMRKYLCQETKPV